MLSAVFVFRPEIDPGDKWARIESDNVIQCHRIILNMNCGNIVPSWKFGGHIPEQLDRYICFNYLHETDKEISIDAGCPV